MERFEKILNFMLDSEDKRKIWLCFRAMSVIMTDEQQEVLNSALAEAEDSYVETKMSQPIPNTVMHVDLGSDRAIERVGGEIFSLQTWFDYTAEFEPHKVTKRQFLKTLLKELFVENAQTFFTWIAWFRFEGMLFRGLDLIENFDGNAIKEEKIETVTENKLRPAIEPQLEAQFREDEYFEKLEARRAGWEF